MIGLDTNVIVRYIVQDDVAQSARATRLIERELSATKPGFVSVVAVVETAWVLERSYGLGKHDIARAIKEMLLNEVLHVDREADVFRAMTALSDGLGSFSDALIAALGTSAGCSKTVTFDRSATRVAGFALL